ncbi:MAG: glucoamylase family protein [Phycisphaerales bacterium]
MKSLTARTVQLGLAGAVVLAAGCSTPSEAPTVESAPAVIGPETRPQDVVIASPAGTARPPFRFSVADERFLEEIQRGAFNWMVARGQGPYGLVPDRSSNKVISTAGVGFQLAALPVAVERGWMPRAEAERRASGILRTLRNSPNIRKAGLYQHFVDLSADGAMLELHGKGLEQVVSTIDSTLLLSGAIVAGQYFAGETGQLADAMIAEVDWTFFQAPGGPGTKPWEIGRISLGWKPKSVAEPTGAGALLPYLWLDNGCEHRLVSLLAACAPDPSHRVDPLLYYRLRRQVGQWPGVEPMVWFPYSGAIFVNQFSHIFVNYASMGPDDPAAMGVANRPRVDWWENSRRVTQLHRTKAIENPKGLTGFGPDGWGLTASDKRGGYQVPGLFPTRVPLAGELPEVDYSTYTPKDDWGDGSLAPYGAGMSIMFEPQLSLAALRNYRAQAARAELAKLWDDPASGGFGFADAFNPGIGWVAPDHLAIDQLPLMLAIENARSGLIWRQFHSNPAIQAGLERMGLKLGNLTTDSR